MQKNINSVNALPVLKLLFSPQFQRKDVDFHVEAAMREHLNLACAKLDETQVKLDDTKAELDETRVKWNETEAQLHDTRALLEETRVSYLNYKLEKKKSNIDKVEGKIRFIWKLKSSVKF